jgi:hypothetical protein
MKKYSLVIVIILVLAAVSIYAITKSENRIFERKANPDGPDTALVNPKVDIKVNKEYDKNGNIIRYDSTYRYIYTYPDGKSEILNMDSVFNNFRPYFFDKGFDLMQKPFHHFFEMDSSFQQHFFDNDYFMQQFEREMFQFEEMMHEMDSLRNFYLKERYPEIKQKKPATNKTGNKIEI